MADIVTSSVEYPGEQITLQAFLARPQDGKPRPAIVVIHEWWGVNDHIKDIAQRFAREGYVALAPDLYSRLGHPITKDAAEAAKLMERLSSQLALKDLNATTGYLKTLPFVDPVKIGVVGFCMGGSFALTLAGHNSDIKAAVPFYGQIPPSDTFKYFLCPILYIYGAQDSWIQKPDVLRLQQGLKDHGKPGEVRIFPNAGHAFFNDTRPEAYRPAEAKEAWDLATRFFAMHLGRP